ncbi:thioredoxin domain-containing protein [Corynebacterium variabile]|uniref:thioredoxin domain-containing protein n=1 Tax=Corynebacterium variabile TaxID=1727 RepID=UPI00289CBD15|nr:thioredoxin domain-containing protein [Corynebacterium variabile]
MSSTPNRLADSTSPYLRQHADNPVDWWPWGPEAFAEARRRDVPVFLSIGYATCHWCHVMARESFSDPDIAAQINAGFVAVKVDREQHPGVDAVYMQATQALTGQGGWPMTVVTDADGRPFFAGTYFRPDQLTQLLAALVQTWREDGTQVDAVAGRLTAALAAASEEGGSASWHADEDTEALPARIVAAGAGVVEGAPTFPPTAALLGLVRYAEQEGAQNSAVKDAALDRVATTLHDMVRGGLFDQLGGGFHRYCVDATWTVPHFEKTLYDNALLVRAMSAYLAHRPEDRLVRRAMELTCSYLTSVMRTGTTGDLFVSSLDADTDGVEGLTYTWTPSEIAEILQARGQDATAAATAYGVTPDGHLDGRSVLTLRGDAPDEQVRQALLAARAQRPQPGIDDKIITAWNAMAAVALTETGDPEGPRVTAALRDHAVLTDDEGTVLDVTRCPGAPGTLEDCAWLLLAMVRAWEHGEDLVSEVSELVSYTQLVFSRDRGTWYDGAEAVAGTGVRPREPYDGATPAAVGVLAEALTYAGRLAQSQEDTDLHVLGDRWLVEARRILDAHGEAVERHLSAAGGWLCALEAHLAGPVTAVTRGASDGQLAALRADLGTSALILRTEDGAGLIGALSDGDGSAALVQICRAGVCGVAQNLGE